MLECFGIRRPMTHYFGNFNTKISLGSKRNEFVEMLNNVTRFLTNKLSILFYKKIHWNTFKRYYLLDRSISFWNKKKKLSFKHYKLLEWIVDLFLLKEFDFFYRISFYLAIIIKAATLLAYIGKNKISVKNSHLFYTFLSSL